MGNCNCACPLIFGFFDREDFLHIFGLLVLILVSHYIAYYVGYKRAHVRTVQYGPVKPVRVPLSESGV